MSDNPPTEEFDLPAKYLLIFSIGFCCGALFLIALATIRPPG